MPFNLSDKMPINEPTWDHFCMTLQFENPQNFQVMKSTISGAGNGLFYKGKIQNKQKICGYGGKVLLASAAKKNPSAYQALCGKTGFLLDAAKLKNNK